MKVLFDVAILVNANVSGELHKTGLYRFSDEILKRLAIYEGLELFLFDSFLRDWELKKYISPVYRDCRILYTGSRIFRTFFFPIADLGEYFKKKERDLPSRFGKTILYVLKNICIVIVKAARRIDRSFFFMERLSKNINRFDTYYTTYFPLPQVVKSNAAIRKVYTLHDLIPVIHPEYFLSSFNQKLVQEVVDSIGPEDYVITVSRSTKNDLLNCRPTIQYEQVISTHLAAGPQFYPEKNSSKIEAMKLKYGIVGEYVLSLCTLEPRKNMSTLVKSFQRILKMNNDIPYQLVLTGSYGWNNDRVLDDIKDINQEFQYAIILTGFVPDEDLASLYSAAKIFVYPSLYEGFGLPVLEAMQCGVPVITSDNSSLPEVVGDSGILLSNPLDSEELATSILEILNNPKKQKVLSEKSKRMAENFKWEITANTIKAVLMI